MPHTAVLTANWRVNYVCSQNCVVKHHTSLFRAVAGCSRLLHSKLRCAVNMQDMESCLLAATPQPSKLLQPAHCCVGTGRPSLEVCMSHHKSLLLLQ